MRSEVRKWIIGLVYIFAVAGIWIAASYVVQSVVDAGISPFLITYVCNALFVIYIPIVEVGRFFEDYSGKLAFWRNKGNVGLQQLANSEEFIPLQKSDLDEQQGENPNIHVDQGEANEHSEEFGTNSTFQLRELGEKTLPEEAKVGEVSNNQLDAKGRWTRTRVAKVSLLICPFWFMAQLFFNLSLKYTTVTVRNLFPLAFAPSICHRYLQISWPASLWNVTFIADLCSQIQF